MTSQATTDLVSLHRPGARYRLGLKIGKPSREPVGHCRVREDCATQTSGTAMVSSTGQVARTVTAAVLVNDPGETANAAGIAREVLGMKAWYIPDRAIWEAKTSPFMLQACVQRNDFYGRAGAECAGAAGRSMSATA